MDRFSLTFSPEDAVLLIGFLASVVVPFLVSLLARPGMPKGAKLAIAIAVSAVGGVLTAYADGAFSGDAINPVVAALAVFSASQLHFSSWFSGLGLDEALERVGS